MTLAIQTYLRDPNNSIGLLKEKFAIDAKRHTRYQNLVLFKYSQVDSPFGEEVVREARGIILDESNNWDVVCWSMGKFFNHLEQYAATIDWKSATVQEKLDGSLVQCFAYDGRWLFGTSGSADAGGSVGDYGFSFQELIQKTFTYALPPVDCGKCFWFELCSIYNKIVVVHPEPSLTLLGGRDLKTMKEMTIAEAKTYFPDCKVVKTFSLGSFEDIVKSFDTFSGSKQEGYVVCDSEFNRVKCKSPEYVSLHHLKDSLGGSRRALVEVVRKGELNEVIAVMPEYKEMLIDAKEKLDALIDELECAYDQVKDIVVQKDFAIELVERNVRCRGALFSLRAGKVNSIKAYLNELHIDSLLALLGYKSNDKGGK